ncbi:MAG: UDP-N-acetylmuramoyl-L-alanine--D-glutamate ligase [Alphaproteobacteria bacterium]|nr:UDP-N-acetylmuramoyl-L-alanine--D-glutamate ligase [Alphaproteobacteria bacterium]
MIRLEAYKNKKVAVFGLGAAGTAAVRALLAGGATVFLWDDKDSSRLAFIDYSGGSVPKEAKLEPIEKWPWNELEILVLSPGIPLHFPQPHPVVLKAKHAHVRIVGEVDLLYEACPTANYIGITGTNGKSTTTALIGHILKQAGKNVQVGANIGVPALALNPADENGYYVLEMSSYMLDLVHLVRFKASVLLNITPDHIDRHGTMENYVQSKLRIFDRVKDKDVCIVGLDDGYCRDAFIHLLREHSRHHLVPFSVSMNNERGIIIDNNGILHDRWEEEEILLDLNAGSKLKGRHNFQNIAAAYGTLRHLGIAPDIIANGIASFPGLAHRMEIVLEKDGVTYVNDSKATNAEAAAPALEAYNNIYWILGGRAKDGGIRQLEKYLPKVVYAFLIGEAAQEFAQTLQGKVFVNQCGNLETAVRQAMQLARAEKRPGATVLLSPACASFDQFKSFEARGDAFRQLVQAFSTTGVQG